MGGRLNVSRKRVSAQSVRAMVGLIAALFLCFIVLLFVAIFLARQEAVRSAENRAEAGCQVVATNTKWIVELAHQALQRIDETLGAKVDMVQGRAVANIADAVHGLPASVNAHVVDAAGNTIYSTNP